MAMNPRLLRPRASGFNPNSIANLAVWFDANDASTITTVSGAVSQWSSKVGGYKATQTTANNRPAYSATSLSGKPGLTFDGSNDQLTSDYNAKLLTGYVTYAAVVQPTAAMVPPATIFPPVWAARNSVANALHINGVATGGPRWTITWRNTLYNSSIGGLVAADNQIVLSTIDATTFTVRVNGTQGTASGTYASGSNETDAVFQFAQDGATGRYFAGVVSEFLMWSRTLTATELRSVELYLSKKWGITVA